MSNELRNVKAENTASCFSSVLLFAQHTACLCDAVIALLKVPLSLQRYFFQKLQSTSIKVPSLPRHLLSKT